MIRVLISSHSPTTYPQTKLARSMSLHRSQRETDHWAIPAPFGALGLRAGGTGQGIDGIRRGWKGNGKQWGMPNPNGGTSEKSPKSLQLGRWFRGEGSSLLCTAVLTARKWLH